MSDQPLNPELVQMLVTAVHQPRCTSLHEWLPHWRAIQRSSDRRQPFSTAIAASRHADRLAWAFFSAYQGALQATFQLGDDASVVNCLCANEDRRRAVDIETSVAFTEGGHRLSGSKSWALADAPEVRLLVLARNAAGPARGPGSLVIVSVPPKSVGVKLASAVRQGIVPELRHIRVIFEDVSLEPGSILPGDGYADYVKPFRLREELFVMGAALAYLVSEARRQDWPRIWVNKAIGAVYSIEGCVRSNLSYPGTHIIVSGVLSSGADLCIEAEGYWSRDAEHAVALANWTRDKPLLVLGEDARRARTDRAWKQLNGQ